MAQIDLTRRTKIVATIGPATESPERIRELIQAGATTFRLNFSHGDHSEHAERMATIRQVAHELGAHIGILQDLQGPKIRLGRFEEGPITLAKGDQFALTAKQVRCNQTVATVTYDKLAEEVSAGSRILLDDGRVEMKELTKFLADQSVDGEVTKRDAWLIMNCADTDNDKTMSFDEFKKMMQTVARGVDMLPSLNTT